MVWEWLKTNVIKRSIYFISGMFIIRRFIAQKIVRQQPVSAEAMNIATLKYRKAIIDNFDVTDDTGFEGMLKSKYDKILLARDYGNYEEIKHYCIKLLNDPLPAVANYAAVTLALMIMEGKVEEIIEDDESPLNIFYGKKPGLMKGALQAFFMLDSLSHPDSYVFLVQALVREWLSFMKFKLSENKEFKFWGLRERVCYPFYQAYKVGIFTPTMKAYCKQREAEVRQQLSGPAFSQLSIWANELYPEDEDSISVDEKQLTLS